MLSEEIETKLFFPHLWEDEMFEDIKKTKTKTKTNTHTHTHKKNIARDRGSVMGVGGQGKIAPPRF